MGNTKNLDLSRKGRTEREKVIVANVRAFMVANNLTSVHELRVKHFTDRANTEKYNLPSRYVIDRTFTDNDLSRTTEGWSYLKVAVEKSIKGTPLSKNDKVA